MAACPEPLVRPPCDRGKIAHGNISVHPQRLREELAWLRATEEIPERFFHGRRPSAWGLALVARQSCYESRCHNRRPRRESQASAGLSFRIEAAAKSFKRLLERTHQAGSQRVSDLHPREGAPLEANQTLQKACNITGRMVQSRAGVKDIGDKFQTDEELHMPQHA